MLPGLVAVLEFPGAGFGLLRLAAEDIDGCAAAVGPEHRNVVVAFRITKGDPGALGIAERGFPGFWVPWNV